MVMSTQTTLLAAALLVVGVACQDTAQEPVFTYPPDGSKYTYHRLDTVIVNYTVFSDTAELSTFCDPGHGRLVDQQTVPGRSASVPILLNFASDEPCWFDLRTGPDGTNSKSSASFNILIGERRTGPQTFGVDTDAPTQSTPTQATPSATSPTHTSDETSSPPPEEGTGGLTGGALYAVAFCSGIVGAILMGLGFQLWWKWECWREERKNKAAIDALADERLRKVMKQYKHGPPRLDVDVLAWRGEAGTGGKGAGGEARDEPAQAV